MESTVATKEQHKAPPEVVVTNKAFNLACSWLQKMNGGADFDAEAETRNLPEDDGAHARPTRLGLGAKYLSHAQASRVSTQVDKKLRAKLLPTKPGAPSIYQGGGGRKARESHEEEAPAPAQEQDDDDDDDDDSRASVFKKRTSAFIRPTLIVSDTAGSKKKKKKTGP